MREPAATTSIASSMICVGLRSVGLQNGVRWNPISMRLPRWWWGLVSRVVGSYTSARRPVQAAGVAKLRAHSGHPLVVPTAPPRPRWLRFAFRFAPRSDHLLRCRRPLRLPAVSLNLAQLNHRLIKLLVVV